MEGQWHDNLIELLSGADYSNNGHISAEMWFNTASNNSSWVEMGLLNAASSSFSAGPGPDPCNCVAYQQFWAAAGGGAFYFHWIDNLSPDGTNHVYEIINQTGSNLYGVYLDYSKIAMATSQSVSTSADIQTGLEDTQGTTDQTLSPNSHADTFNNYIQYDSGGNFSFAPFQYFEIDNPCGPSYAQGYCMNGQYPVVGQYSFNKP